MSFSYWCVLPCNATIQRLTARVLLILLLVGSFAPVALAASATPPHACCLRKPLHDQSGRGSQFQPVACEHHSCCPPLARTHWAEASFRHLAQANRASATLTPDLRQLFRGSATPNSRSVRAPPQFCIA